MMQRKAMEQVERQIQSRKLARALNLDARSIRAGWTDTDRQFGRGRYRWYRKGLRVELMRLRVNSPPWPWGMTA